MGEILISKMWRFGCINLLRQSVASPNVRFINSCNLKRYCLIIMPTTSISSSFSTCSSSGNEVKGNIDSSSSSTAISSSEARKLMRLVDVEALKMKLLGGNNEDKVEGGKEVIPYKDFLEVCQGFGVAKSSHEAAVFARVLDDAGVVLLFRDKVFLHPHKVLACIIPTLPSPSHYVLVIDLTSYF